MTPLVEPLPDSLTPVDAFRRLVDRPHLLFLDSALPAPGLGDYSFVAADPVAWLSVPADGSDGLARLQQWLTQFSVPFDRTERIAELPPFQGGVAGLFSYDLNRGLETVPAARHDEFGLPALACGIYDVVLAFDHRRDQGWLISHGVDSDGGQSSQAQADRVRQFQAWLAREPADLTPCPGASSPLPLDASQLAPQYPMLDKCEGRLTSSFSREDYLIAVDRAIRYIEAGDIFQVNLAQRLLHPATDSSLELYLRLRHCNPAPFAGYLDLDGFQVCSASPERFVSVRERVAEARPIKGTRQRTAQPEADLFAAGDLLESEKDRAENVMIVDLLRNDLSRVCRPESVKVTQLCQVEVYQYVQHLVSAIEGRLRDDASPLDLLRASFPGGSITGAPKVRAMEIIAELEPTARGPYCGSLGYLSFDGTLDLSILIRTITAGRGWWQLPVGGGIVAQSVPRHEYEETWHKAAGLLKALR